MFGKVQVYDLNSEPVHAVMFGNTNISKVILVNITIKANEFNIAGNKLISFDYTKLFKNCSYAQIVSISTTKGYRNESLENSVIARVQYIDLVKIIIGVLNNNKKEDINLTFIVYGN